MSFHQCVGARFLLFMLCISFLGSDSVEAQRRGRPGGNRGPARQQASSSDRPATSAGEKAKEKEPTLPQSVADQVTWRSIGPANMSGRITALAVYEKDPCIWWASTASGGLLKTTNNGRTLEHQFDDQSTVSIGDVQVAQSDPNIVWVGTGEGNPRNSVSWGDGVYKSTDGGKTWTNMGLKKSFQIGALAIHPENPDVVWVGALGRLWGPNMERGLFKTTDGGKNWRKVLFVDDKTGVIDVQLDPKNPDNLLVATYERKRDGFDGNDPVQRFGAGSGIYRSKDGGESFMRVTEGLPTCQMGRIGLDYFESDPNVVVAIIESEKIAKRPETSPYLGIRGENADVGARLTNVTKDGPAEKAGLKDSDIVVSVEGNIVMSYNDFLSEVRKHQAGDKINMVIAREREKVDVEIELGKQPESRSRSSRNEFTGTLGGQAANLQGQQGPDENEYGGIYMSEDGGDSWKRINTLNPRPMYYSNIQIDPVDRNNIYVCGTSLYKSKDGGKTFTGDGGSDGIHVDHHALWIDKRDPRHMILGNDGGIHVTYDRMTHWDHLNHVAIGQFYHVGIDSTLDYKVYGGLQDNGSWGGPSRGAFGSGPVNSDWMRVGGGDGFVTLVDPEDPNQIYFESQNGGMGRIHLETGARGFIRPRPPRGVRYRFNWKTPFILSPHNSKIHYSAGNHVFRSYQKGDGTKAISPDITNSDRGAGSAISESSVQPGLLYVGTTDGAVWMTENGGQDWKPLFYQPQPKEEKKDEEEKKADDKSDEKGKTSDEESKSEKPESPQDKKDVVSGSWSGKMISDRIPEDRAAFNFTLKLDGEKVSGMVEGRRGDQEFSDGKFDPKTGDISWTVESERGAREYSGKISGNKMSGEMSIGDGRFQIEFEAKRDDKAVSSELATENAVASAAVRDRFTLLAGLLYFDDPISGEWLGAIEDENLPGGRVEFTIDFKMDDKNQLSGNIYSSQGESKIVAGTYNANSKKVVFDAENEQFGIEIQASVEGNSMSGTMSINDGSLEVEFEATKKVAESEEQPQAEDEKPEAKAPEMKGEEKSAEAAPKSEDKPSADDPVTGKWSGNMISPRGEREMQMNLKFKSNEQISGTFESSQGERDISSGKFEPESGTLTLTSETEQFTIEFNGKVEGDEFAGEMDINDGAFTMEFELTRESKQADEPESETEEESTEEQKYVQPTGEKTLSGLMPGPRWVSSIETSHFNKDRCYITFDGHRSDDDGVYVFATNDGGKSWESIRGNLPDTAGSARVIREDLKNENLLLLGCEFSSWYSIDRGKTWTRMKGGLPTVSVHEFAIHDTRQEVVAGTHGRSLWIADISILRQLSPESLAADVSLYQPKDAIVWSRRPSRGASGTRRFVGTNPSSGTMLAYSLGKNARRVSLHVQNLEGDTVKTFEASNRKGFHQLRWDLSEDSESGGGRFRRSVSPGKYLLVLKVDGERKQTIVDVVPDPSSPSGSSALSEEEALFID